MAAAGVLLPPRLVGVAGHSQHVVLSGERDLHAHVGRILVPLHGQCPGDVEVVHFDRSASICHGRGESHLQVGGGRHHDRTTDPVVREPRHTGGFQRSGPDRVDAGLPDTEKRMVYRPSVPDLRTVPPTRITVPVVLPLPRVGRQAHHSARALVPAIPIDFGSTCEHGRRRAPELVQTVVGTPSGRHDSHGRPLFACQAGQVRGQHMVWADFHQDVAAVGQHAGHRRGEAHRLPDVLPPVVGVQFAAHPETPGHRGIEGNRGVSAGEPGQQSPKPSLSNWCETQDQLSLLWNS